MNTISNKFTRFKQSCHCALCQAAARASGRAGTSRRATAYSTASFRQLIISPCATATAFYTSIVACAMTMDGGLKTNRLIKWESAIAYERSTIKQLSAEENRIKEKLAQRLHFEDDIPDMNSIEGIEGLNEQQLQERAKCDIPEDTSSVESAQQGEIAKHNSESNQDQIIISEEDTNLHMEEVSDWQKAYKENPCEHGQALELSAPVLGPEQQIENIDPQSIYAPPRLRQLLYSHRWTPKKLRTAEIVTARLVVQLLLHYKLHLIPNYVSDTSEGVDVKQDDIEEDMEESRIPAKIRQLVCISREELKELDNSLYQEKEALTDIDPFDENYDDSLPEFIPAYSQDPSGKFHKVIREVNNNIFSNFYKYRAGETDLRATIANVCNELLTSSSAPNLHTYNMLLIELPFLARNSSFPNAFINSDDDAVFDSRNSSSQSLTASVAKKNGPVMDSIFTALRDAKIRPNETTCAVMLNHYTERDDAESFAYLVTLMRGEEDGLMLARPNITYDPGGSTKTRLKPKVGRPNKIIQAVTPTPTVSEALIGGVLRFVGLNHALEMIESLAHNGWAFDERGLSIFVRHCAYKKDWKNGIDIWKRIRGLILGDSQLNDITSASSENDTLDNPLSTKMSSIPLTAFSHRLSCTAYRACIALCWNCNQMEVLRATVKEAVQVCGYPIKSLLGELRSRDRSRAHLWIRICAFGEEKVLDRHKSSDETILRLDIAAKEQEIFNADKKELSRNENESKLEQDQEITVKNPVVSASEPSPSTVITQIPTSLDQSPATTALLASSSTPEDVLHHSPSSTSTTSKWKSDNLETLAEEQQRHPHHTPSLPLPVPTTTLRNDTDNDYTPTAPLPTITTTSSSITPGLAPMSSSCSSSSSSPSTPSTPSPSSSLNSSPPILSPASSPTPSLTLSSSSSSSPSSTSVSTTIKRTTTPPPPPPPPSSSSSSSSLQHPPRSLPSPSPLRLPTPPFFTDTAAVVNADLNMKPNSNTNVNANANVNVSDVDPHDIPLVGIIST